MNCTASGVIVFYLTNNCWIDSFAGKKKKKGTESACATYVTSNSLIVVLVDI